MGVLTENEVKRKIGKNKNNITEFYIEKGQIITPSAKSYLAERSIELKYVDKLSDVNNEPKEVVKEVVKEKKYKYTTVFGANWMKNQNI